MNRRRSSATKPRQTWRALFVLLAIVALVAAAALPRWAQGEGGGEATGSATVTIQIDGYTGEIPQLKSGEDFTLGEAVKYDPRYWEDSTGAQPLASLIEGKEAEGYSLEWKTASGAAFDWFATPVSEDVTVRGSFVESGYSVHVSFNDAVTEDITVTVPKGKSFKGVYGSVPKTPTMDGWEFVRWVNADDSSTFDFSAPVKGSTTVYALFEVADTEKVVTVDPTKSVKKSLSGRCYIGATWSVHPAHFSVSQFTGDLKGCSGTGTCALRSAAAPHNVWADYTATLKSIDEDSGEVVYDVYIVPPGVAHAGGPRNQFGLIGYQPVSFTAVVHMNFGGYLELNKTSLNPEISEGNSRYNLAGAEFGVYNKKNKKVATLTTDAQGKTGKTKLIPTGSYTIKEEKAPDGYIAASNATAKVKSGKTTTVSVGDTPQCSLVDLVGQKVDKETGKPLALGGATLAGARYRVSYYDSYQDDSKTYTKKDIATWGDAKRTWVLESDAEGKICLDADHKVEGGEFYHDSNGKIVLPLGTVVIEETQAPTGYLKNNEIIVSTLKASGTSEHVEGWKSKNLVEEVIRSDFSFVKAKSGTMNRLANVPFKITSRSTGESHILVTDQNGMANTASNWCAHSQNTNAGTSADDGIWFGMDAQGNMAAVDDSLGALPFDTYDVEEQACEANEGLVLASFTVTISRNNSPLYLGTVDDDEIPSTPPEEEEPEPLLISGDIDKRETLLDENGVYDYTVDYRSTSNTWADEFTMTDSLTCAKEGYAYLTGLTTPVSFEDYDGKMNIWYRTNLDEEAANGEEQNAASESEQGNSTNTEQTAAMQTEETSDAAQEDEGGATVTTSTEPNACSTNPYSEKNPNNQRVHDLSGWHIWRTNVSTLDATELSVDELDLKEGEYITEFAFEHGRIEVGFGTNAQDAEDWSRAERYIAADTTTLPLERTTFNLQNAVGLTHTEESTEVTYAPAILHMQATEVALDPGDTDLWNEADIDINRDLVLHDDDHDAVVQSTNPVKTTVQNKVEKTAAEVTAVVSKLPKTDDVLAALPGAIPLLTVAAAAATPACVLAHRMLRRNRLKGQALGRIG